MFYGGKEVEAIIEGGKGINVSTGLTAGRFAACGAIGTFSGVNPDARDENGNLIERVFQGKTRQERQKELVDHAIKGALTQAKIAHVESKGQGRIFMNVLWEMGACVDILEGVLSKAKGLIHGITCGAGMPYQLAEIAAKYTTYYNPIVSSARAFKILWKRSYEKNKEWLGAVVYEDPWKAGGHNGLSNAENPKEPQRAYERLVELRTFMNEVGLKAIPIIIAGSVWCLSEWVSVINNPQIGPVVFQFGTRPLVTQESPITEDHKQYLFSLTEGDVSLQQFSPTGFYSSAARNDFLKMLEQRSARQVPFSMEPKDDLTAQVALNGQTIFVSEADREKIAGFIKDGFDVAMKTPDSTVVFASSEEAKTLRQDMRDCVGCLSVCQFSGWSQYEGVNPQADPRSFCIQKTLMDISHGGKVQDNLIFAGQIASRFGTDPFYEGGKKIPTIAELVAKIKTGA
ncbi:MAG: nitronate monooxygenase [Alphaproteobacteria bacterium]|nr:nitronate monooxygenase [Alphaproteobacteria bacterium]MBN2779710.1 nitronate monooxygenase [Alphaproteobacteria bacterium]